MIINMLINVNIFGGVIIIHYLCITESVINPTGGEPGGGRVDSTALIFFLISPRPLLGGGNKKFPHVMNLLVRSRMISSYM
jgi:hypothetical protein